NSEEEKIDNERETDNSEKDEVDDEKEADKDNEVEYDKDSDVDKSEEPKKEDDLDNKKKDEKESSKKEKKTKGKYKDGSYKLPFKVLKEDKDDISTTEQYIKNPAKVIIKGDVYKVQIGRKIQMLKKPKKRKRKII